VDLSEPPSRLLALDLETTGLEPKRDAIVALGCVPVEERTIFWGRSRRALVDDPRSLRSPRPRDLAALWVHQVLPEEQRGGLGLRALVELVEEALAGGAVLLAHGAAIERRFLASAAASVEAPPLALRTLCTLVYLRSIESVRPHIADRLPPGAGRHAAIPTALAPAREFFGLPAYPEHDPLFDALGAAELYLLLSQRFPELHPRVQS
jgi:DNA polymerase III subunit epsilon